MLREISHTQKDTHGTIPLTHTLWNRQIHGVRKWIRDHQRLGGSGELLLNGHSFCVGLMKKFGK